MAPCSSCKSVVVAPGEVRPRCIVGPRSSKCSECIKHNRKSCDVSLAFSQWEKLRSAREALRRDIESLEEEEVEILQRLSRDQQALSERRMKKIRLRKQLRLAENRVDGATALALEELESEDPAPESVLPFSVPSGVEVPDQSFFHGILEMPLDHWSTITGVPLDDPLKGLFSPEPSHQESAV